MGGTDRNGSARRRCLAVAAMTSATSPRHRPGRGPRWWWAVAAACVTLAVACTSKIEPPAPLVPSELAATAAPTRLTPPTGPAPGATGAQPGLDTGLIAASWANDVDRARQLIGAGADVNYQDGTRQSAYLISASEGRAELLELTLQHGAEIDARDSYNGTSLIRAAERGHAAIVGRLLRTGINVDHVNNLGWTALHEAIILGDGSQRYLDTVRLLVARGADIYLVSARDGKSPIAHAEGRNQAAVTRLLHAALSAPAATNGPAATTRASAAASVVAAASPKGDLFAAAASGDADQAALALRAGADLESRDGADRTPLLLAVAGDRLDVARLLVALGASPDALDDRHDSPWLVTGETGSVAMADILLAARPDLTIRNRFGGISIIPASERGHVDYVRRVARTGMDLNHVNNLGWTALLEAVILGNGTERYQQVVQILLDAGADPAIADRNGITPLQHAQARGHSEIIRILSSPR